MDSTFLLVSKGFILEEFQTAEAALEFREFMQQEHPGQRYDLVADG